jgi:hypothetical protein
MSTTSLTSKTYLSNLIFFVKPLRRNEFSRKLLKLITYIKVKNAFILDYEYHKNTTFLLQTLSVLTIGPLPVSSNYKNIDIVIPSIGDNLFLQFFFIKLIFFHKKYSEHVKYLNRTKTWLSFTR